MNPVALYVALGFAGLYYGGHAIVNGVQKLDRGIVHVAKATPGKAVSASKAVGHDVKSASKHIGGDALAVVTLGHKGNK